MCPRTLSIARVPRRPERCRSPVARQTWKSQNTCLINCEQLRSQNIPIRLTTEFIKCIHYSIQRKRTGTKRIVCPLELLTRDIVVALGTNALEVIRVILVTKDRHVNTRLNEKNNNKSTNSLSGSCLGNGLHFPRQCLRTRKHRELPSNGTV